MRIVGSTAELDGHEQELFHCGSEPEVTSLDCEAALADLREREWRIDEHFMVDPAAIAVRSVARYWLEHDRECVYDAAGKVLVFEIENRLGIPHIDASEVTYGL